MRSRIILLVAIIMSVITTLLFFSYLNRSDSTQTPEEQLIDVVVANQAIGPNQLLSQDMVSIQQVPSQHVHPSAITSIDAATGMFALTTIEQGEIILSHRLKSTEDEKRIISRKVTDGKRAVSVGVTIVQSVSNLVQPEDYVDVVYTKTGNGDSPSSTTQLLSRVRVLAVGQKLTPIPNDQEAAVEYSSITLELSPKDAVTLINAAGNGIIHLTLHSSIRPAE